MAGASAAGLLQSQSWLQHQLPLAELVGELWQGAVFWRYDFSNIFCLDWQVGLTLSQLTDKALDRGLVLLEAKERGNLGCL